MAQQTAPTSVSCGLMASIKSVLIYRIWISSKNGVRCFAFAVDDFRALWLSNDQRETNFTARGMHETDHPAEPLSTSLQSWDGFVHGRVIDRASGLRRYYFFDVGCPGGTSE